MGNPLLEAALEYASRGWPIFPARQDKRPYTDHGVLDATTNIRQIEEWWATWPTANVALDVGGAGMMVLDLDPGHDMKELENNVGEIPNTRLVATSPRGGRHLYFGIGSDDYVPASASKLAPHVDVRSFHSYVLLPPSKTEAGEYCWESTGTPAYRSDEMYAAAHSTREKSEDRDEWLIEADLEDNVALAVGWLLNDAKPAIENQGGDATAYATAAMCKSYGISEETAFDLMLEHWNPRCQPPWGADETDHLRAKVENAYAYNTSPPGNLTPAYHTARTSKLFQAVRADIPEGDETRVAGFRIADRDALDHVRPPDWLIFDFIPDESYVMLFGAYSTFKTFLALDVALTLACEYETTTTLWTVSEGAQGPVLFMAGEGRSSIAKRVMAWEQQHNNGEKVSDFVLVDPVPLINITEEYLAALVDDLLRRHPEGYRLAVLDTLGRSMAGENENEQKGASQFTLLVQRLKAELGGSVLVLHHSGHAESDRARGSSVFGADPDTLVRIDREGKSHVVKLSMTKQKDAPEWPKPKYAGVREVALAGDGGNTLVVTKAKAVDLPKVENVTSVDLVLDKALADVLQSNPTRYWTQGDLAVKLARHPLLEGVPESALKNVHLKRLRAVQGAVAHRCFDDDRAPKAGQWTWREA